jgi:hypothetical protein
MKGSSTMKTAALTSRVALLAVRPQLLGRRPGGQVSEFKAMVDALHRAGLEVVLDVAGRHDPTAGGR